jgi:hypothetical protein
MDVNKFIELVAKYLSTDESREITIQYRLTSGLCVKSYIKNVSWIIIEHIYFGDIYRCKYYTWYFHVVDIEKHNPDCNFGSNRSRTYLIYDDDGLNGDRIDTRAEDPGIYTDVYKYGLLTDSNHLSKILRLFLVKPRDARPINRLAFLDISVKTE